VLECGKKFSVGNSLLLEVFSLFLEVKVRQFSAQGGNQSSIQELLVRVDFSLISSCMQTLLTVIIYCLIVFIGNSFLWYMQDMICAGTDTSATTVGWALVELLRHPEAMKKAQAELDDVIGSERVVDEGDIHELKYLQAIVKETFRLHPPAPLLPHESIGDCTVGGYFIPAKTRIFVNAWAVHRHPSAYQKPLEFNPSRFVGSQIDVKGLDFQLLPFGSGRRMCPGLRLGLIMVQLELARLLHSFTWKLPAGQDPQDIDMDEMFGLTAPKAIPLHVVATARLPLHLYTAPGTTH